MILSIEGSQFLFSSHFQTSISKISYKRTDSSGYEWLQVTTNDTSDYKPDYKWLRVNTNKNVGELSFTDYHGCW